MPSTVNGFGTSLCGSRGDVGWGSCDAMEWIVALFMPLIPIKAVHTFDWDGNRFRAIPITWSWGLTVRTFLGRWVWGLGAIGVILLFSSIAALPGQDGVSLGLFIAAVVLLGLAITIVVVLRRTDVRNKAIRRVLGANTIGHCDPANLPRRDLEQMAGSPRLAHGTDSFAEAARVYLNGRAFARAMWAARVCVALEDRDEGESLTDTILADPDVVAAIEEVCLDAGRWQPLMFAGEVQLAAEPKLAPLDVLPAEEDDRLRPA